MGFPQQTGQQWRRGIPADLPAVCLYLQLCRSSGGIRHGAVGGHRHPGGLPQCLGHPWRNSREGGRCAGLAAAGGLPVHCYRVCRYCYLCAESAGGFPDRHPDDRRYRRLVRFLFGAALFGGALSHHRSGGHPAYAVPGGPQHRKDQQDHDAAVFPHLPGAGGTGIFPARRRGGISIYVYPAVGSPG